MLLHSLRRRRMRSIMSCRPTLSCARQSSASSSWTLAWATLAPLRRPARHWRRWKAKLRKRVLGLKVCVLCVLVRSHSCTRPSFILMEVSCVVLMRVLWCYEGACGGDIRVLRVIRVRNCPAEVFSEVSKLGSSRSSICLLVESWLPWIRLRQ